MFLKDYQKELAKFFTVLSFDPDTIKLQGKKLHEYTLPSWPFNVKISRKNFPDFQGEKLHEVTQLVWPFKVLMRVPEESSQIFKVWSTDPETKVATR